MNNHGFGPIDEVYTSEVIPVGTIREEPPGYGGVAPKRYRFVKNNTVSAFVVGEVVVRGDGLTGYLGLKPSTSQRTRQRVLGFVQHAIAAGSFGWIQCGGFGTVKAQAGSGLTADTNFVVSNGTAGTVEDMAAGDEHLVIGQSAAAIAAGATGTAFIDCPDI